MKNFGVAERTVLSFFGSNASFTFNDKKYIVIDSGKPTCSSGEPKTDIYVLANEIGTTNNVELKISYKKDNADFLENKISAERAKQIFGDAWRDIIMASTESIKESFKNAYVLYKEKYKRTQKGCITLGWKFEFVNKTGGTLSGKLELTKQQLYDVYAGTNISQDKKDSFVNGKCIKNSGVANYFLMKNSVSSLQELINNLIPIDKYIEQHPDIYFACKALNYRTNEKKYDGDRPLSVQVVWDVVNGKLVHQIRFDKPLERNGNAIAKILFDCLKEINVENTDEINSSNCDMKNVYNG